MLEVARTKFKPGEQIELRAADATALPFLDSSFDAAVCQLGLMFFPDKDKSHREINRVLAPGGHYLFSVWDLHRYNAFARIAHEIGASFFPSNPPLFYNVPFSCHQIDPIKEALIGAGFGDINVAVVKLVKEVVDAELFAHGLVYGNPLADEIRARGGDPNPVVDALTQTFRGEFGADPGRMTIQAIVFCAQKPAPSARRD